MVDTAKIQKQMMFSEYEKAREICKQCKIDGLPIPVTVAVAYKAGLMEGKNKGKKHIKAAYQRLDEAKKRAECLEDDAYIAFVQEFCVMTPDEQIELITNTRNMLDMMEKAIQNRMDNPTSGDEMEDQNNG